MIVPLLIIAIVSVCLLTFGLAEMAEAGHGSKRCSVRGYSSIYPVHYDESLRTNPDRTAYPGDAFHFVFKFTASEGCSGFRLNTMTSTGAISVYSGGGGGRYEHQVPTAVYFDKDDRLKHGEKRGWNLLYRQGSPSSLGPASIIPVMPEIPTVGGHPWEDIASANKFRENVKRICDRQSGARAQICVYGHAEVSIRSDRQECLVEAINKLSPRRSSVGVSDKCVTIKDTLTQSASATGTKCNSKGCSKYTSTGTARSGITLRDPTPDISFRNPPILDLDLYDSKNKDVTYYVWDAPAIQTVPDLLFRDIRPNVLTFGVDREGNSLTEIFSETCTDGHCQTVASAINITDTTIQGINGDNLDVFMPQSLNKLGIHNFTYNVKVFNIGREIGKANSTTGLFIVDYSPKYSENLLSYILLETDGETTFQKNWGTAMQYHGSDGTGPDDEEIIHGDRRSKINDSEHSVIGIDTSSADGSTVTDFMTPSNATNATAILSAGLDKDSPSSRTDPFMPRAIDTTYHMIGGDDIVDIVASVEPSILETSGKDSLGEYDAAMLSNGNTSLFTNAGFGRIKYAESGESPIIKNATVSEVVIFNTVRSINFGGYDETKLLEYSYDYPSASLTTVLNLTGIHSDGTRNNELDFTANLEVVESNGTKYLSQYMASHIRELKDLDGENNKRQFKRNLPDTSYTHKEKFVDMYLGDMHDITNTLSGTGSETSVLRLPAVAIPFTAWKELNIRDANDPNFNIYGETYGLNAPGFYRLTIDTNGRENTFDYPILDFTNTLNHTINVDDDNYLNHTRYLASVYLTSPDVFGLMSSVSINDGDPITSCSQECYIQVNENVTIVAENIWGGTASHDVIKQVRTGTGNQSEIVVAYIDNVSGPLIFLLMITMIILIYLKYTKSR